MSRRENRSQAEYNRRSKRLEPSIGHVDLEIDPAEREQARSAARWRRFRRELVNWLLVISLLLVLIAGCVGAAVYFGALQYPQDFVFASPPAALIICGFAVFFLAQITAAVLEFQTNRVACLLCLLLPGYLLLGLKSERSYWPVVGAWLLGATLIGLGTWLLE